jgi:hypothetical protein
VIRSDTTIPGRHDEMPVSKIPGPSAEPAPEALFPEARRRRRRRWIVSGIALLVLSGLLGWVLGSGSGHAPRRTGTSSAHPRPPVIGKTLQESASPTSCSFGPTPGFLEGTVKAVTATTVGVSAGTACTDTFPIGPTTSTCWATCGDTWANVWTHLTPEDVVDVQASTNADGSVIVQWIDIDPVSGEGVVTAVPTSSEVSVQLTRGQVTDSLLISSSTITQSGSQTVTGSSELLQPGEMVSFTGGAVGPGPITPDVYALRISVGT